MREKKKKELHEGMQYEGCIRLKIAGIMGRGWVHDVYPVTESQ